jgi:hypothetical protein
MHPFKRLLVDILMASIFISLLAFALWLIWITFFRETFDTGLVSTEEQTELERIATGRAAGSTNEHFHNVDEAVLAGGDSASLCLKCHGNYPHSKAPDIRAFLNAHAYFAACEVCHIRPDKEDLITYKWLDNKTGLELGKLQGKAGNYGGMIVPIKVENGIGRRLDESTDKAFIEEYMELRATFNADQQAEAKVRIHKDISAKPMFCDECHSAKGILNFKDLLYSPVVAERLETGEVAGMINKYADFYLPTMFDPSATFRGRKNELERRQQEQETP